MLIDGCILFLIIASMLVLVDITHGEPRVIAAATLFIITVGGLWLKFRH
ncbi:hypothetical protein [Nocardia crassostreae]|nr:hypothetical protein [Nocardia crassostreae]